MSAPALSKLYYSGLGWLHPDNMKATLLRTTLAPMEFDWTVSIDLLQAPDAVFVALAVVGLFTELLFGLVLISRKARQVLPAAMAATHGGILFLQNILFVDLILLQAVFYDVTPVRRAIGRWLALRRGRVQVLYDGHCGLCQRSVRILQGLDISNSSSGSISGRRTLRSIRRGSSTKWRPFDVAASISGSPRIE